MAPGVKIFQTVGPHDPDKTDVRPDLAKTLQGIVRVSGAKPGLNAGDLDPRVFNQGTAQRHTRKKRLQIIVTFERISRRHQPPDLIQVGSNQRMSRNQQMPHVRGVEGSAEKPDGHPWFHMRNPQPLAKRSSRQGDCLKGGFGHCRVLGT